LYNYNEKQTVKKPYEYGAPQQSQRHPRGGQDAFRTEAFFSFGLEEGQDEALALAAERTVGCCAAGPPPP
jgi:hypothetical protein